MAEGVSSSLNEVFLFSIGVGTAFVITSSDNARLVEAEHPATVIAIAIANVVNFLIGDLPFLFFMGELVLGRYCWVLPYAKQSLHLSILRGNY